MTPEKKQTPAAAPLSRPAPASGTGGRKPWIRRSPVEVVLDQIRKQEERVAEMQEQLNREKRELEKLQKAKDVLEGK
jgi:hypothetical protein